MSSRSRAATTGATSSPAAVHVFLTLLTRAWAANLAEMRGARLAVLRGLLVASCPGVAYLAGVLMLAVSAALALHLLIGTAKGGLHA